MLSDISSVQAAVIQVGPGLETVTFVSIRVAATRWPSVPGSQAAMNASA